MKKLKNYFKGFTLVELIIVITILAILATIAFVSFQGYVSDARDANRTATVKNIEKGLTLYKLKTNKFPAPYESTPFTGGLEGKIKINQGKLGENVARVINMSDIPLDPKDKSKYTYSTFGDDHKYYQVAINAENNQTSFIPETYAFTPKSAIVKGNYRFDPSLPSLIVVPSSIEGKTIFDPKVCFVVDGGKNSLDNCVEKKEEMSLKDFDSSLVGYWDMETTSGSLLKDLSGNGNNGFCYNSGIIVNCGEIGNGPQIIDNYMYFNGIDRQYVEIQDNDLLEFGNNGTIFIKFKIKGKSGINMNSIDYAKLLTKLDSGNGCISLYTYNSHVTYLANDSYTGTNLSYVGDLHNVICENDNTITGKGERSSSGEINLIDRGKIFNTDYVINDRIYNGNYSNYINGKKKIYHNNKNYFLKDTDNNWHIGRGKIYYLNGFIDEIKIYNRALTDEEIKQQAKIAGF